MKYWTALLFVYLSACQWGHMLLTSYGSFQWRSRRDLLAAGRVCVCVCVSRGLLFRLCIQAVPDRVFVIVRIWACLCLDLFIGRVWIIGVIICVCVSFGVCVCVCLDHRTQQRSEMKVPQMAITELMYNKNHKSCDANQSTCSDIIRLHPVWCKLESCDLIGCLQNCAKLNKYDYKNSLLGKSKLTHRHVVSENRHFCPRFRRNLNFE